MPFGLGKCVILWYIEVALGFVGVNVIGFVGCVYTLERFKVCRPSSVVRRASSSSSSSSSLSSVPIKFPRKYISNDYYILVFTLSR